MTPDWIPNIHPLIVHFPVALLITGALVDILRIAMPLRWMNSSALLLYVTGTAGLFAAYITGQQAVDSVQITGAAATVVTTHEDWALYTTLFFILFLVLRVVAFRKYPEGNLPIRGMVAMLAVTGSGMLWYTGERGVELVFRHGVAVGEVQRLNEEIADLERTLAGFREEAAPVLREDGSWSWRPGPGAEQAMSQFRIEEQESFRRSAGRDDTGPFLEIAPGSGKSFLLFGDQLEDVEGILELHADDLDGQVELIHHFRYPENYQYVRIGSGMFTQGQVIDGSDRQLGSGEIDSAGWITIRATAAGTHFYGYKNGRTITHTHADALPAGWTGISFDGEGFLRVRRIEFRPL